MGYTIGLIAVSVLLLTSLYVNYILYRKILFFERWYENLAEVVENIYEGMRIMDETGAMDQDDAFGDFFDSMREMMMQLFSMGFYDPEQLEGIEVKED